MVEDRDDNSWQEDCRWSHRTDEWIHEGDAMLCDADDNWYHADDCNATITKTHTSTRMTFATSR